MIEYIVYHAREKDDKQKYKVNLYQKKPEQDLDLELALKIYNATSNAEQTIDWNGFKLFCELYYVEDVKLFSEYMIIIKSTIANFDEIYKNKCNTDSVSSLSKYIADNSKKKGGVDGKTRNKNR